MPACDLQDREPSNRPRRNPFLSPVLGGARELVSVYLSPQRIILQLCPRIDQSAISDLGRTQILGVNVCALCRILNRCAGSEALAIKRSHQVHCRSVRIGAGTPNSQSRAFDMADINRNWRFEVSPGCPVGPAPIYRRRCGTELHITSPSS